MDTAWQKAHDAGLRRLESANNVILNDEDEELAAKTVLAAPYCGCETCAVREVLHAAWPYLYALAHDPSTPVPEVVA